MTRLVQCLFASVCICMGQSFTKEYDLSSLCGSSVVFDDAVILKVNSLRRSCSDVTVYADNLSGHHQLRVEVRSLNVPCWQHAYLGLYDSSSRGTPIGHVCSGQGSYQSMYVTSSSTLTVETSNPLLADVSLELLVTVTSRSNQLGDFQCDNGFYLPYSLRNDGNNNCGDLSDEQSSLSPDFPLPVIVIVIVFGIAFVAIIVAQIVRYCCCQQQSQVEQYQRLPSGGPNYGSIRGYPNLAPGTVYVHAPPPATMATPPATMATPSATMAPLSASMAPLTASMVPAHGQHGHAHHQHGHAHRQHGHAHRQHGHAHLQHGHAHLQHGHAYLQHGHAHLQHCLPSRCLSTSHP